MDLIAENRAVFATLAGLALVILLILKWRSNAFATLLGCAILTALLAGMAPETAFKSVQNGMGGTLGFIAPVIGLGALFGAIMEQSGAVQVLAQRLSGIKGDRRQSSAVGVLGLIAAIPVFFDVALIILLPFVINLAQKAKRPTLFFGLPLCVGLAIGHAFIPPTPGPIAIAELIGANLGQVIIMGLGVSVICLAVAGPLLTIGLYQTGRLPGAQLEPLAIASGATIKGVKLGKAFAVMILPIVLIMVSTVSRIFLPEGIIRDFIYVIGHPFSALIISCLASWYIFAPQSETDKTEMTSALARAFEPTAIVILVTGAGGAFKQVLVDTGAGADIANHFLAWGVTPVILAFSLALLVRALQGSATVAMITAAGLMAPIIMDMGLSDWQLAVLTITIAAGATGLSHVNDSGFWLVSRLFQITEKETLRSWTLATTVISVIGLILSSILYMIVG